MFYLLFYLFLFLPDNFQFEIYIKKIEMRNYDVVGTFNFRGEEERGEGRIVLIMDDNDWLMMGDLMMIDDDDGC